MHSISALLHQFFMSSFNDTSRTIIIISLIEHDADNMNNMLLLTLILIITMIRLFCHIIVCMMTCCMFQNLIFFFILNLFLICISNASFFSSFSFSFLLTNVFTAVLSLIY